jgi:hypothetical protein
MSLSRPGAEEEEEEEEIANMNQFNLFQWFIGKKWNLFCKTTCLILSQALKANPRSLAANFHLQLTR